MTKSKMFNKARLKAKSLRPFALLSFIAFSGLGGCETIKNAMPNYPIYMQNKPEPKAETPTDTTEAVPETTPVAPPEPITTNELPPPPPPPPTKTELAQAAAPINPEAKSKEELAPAQTPATQAVYFYIMQPRDTLFGVSRRFGVPIKTIYAMNALSADQSVRVGQKILLPGEAKDKGIEERANGAAGLEKLNLKPVTKPSIKPNMPKPVDVKTEPVKPVEVKKPEATAKEAPAKETKPVVNVPAPIVNKPSAAQKSIAERGRGRFIWPLEGKILVKFGQLGPNVRNDGINIAGTAGSDVKAAADGVVAYVGDEVKALGKTVYIQNGNGWYTGYSHLASTTVKTNQKIKQGQAIGTLGMTGAVDRPQLHFEIRYTPNAEIAKPIDPMLVLP